MGSFGLSRPQLFLLFLLLVLVSASSSSSSSLAPPPSPTPPFWYGSATSSYQIEGGSQEGGRGPSIWDTFSHRSGKTARGETGDVAADFYHRYAEDIKLVAELGVEKFRLPLSWPRIFPNRTVNDDGVLEQPNERGFEFYERVLDALEESSLEPLVTLYHCDLPQALQDAYGGWTSPRIVDDFRAYARVIFERLGERKRRRSMSGDGKTTPSSAPQIKFWTSLNEPWVFCFLRHTVGLHAPGLKSPEAGWACARNALLAHLAAAEEFEKVFGGGEGGDGGGDGGGGGDGKEREGSSRPLLSVNIPCLWADPWSPDSRTDCELAHAALDFDGMGIFGDVLFKGQWPESVLLALAEARASGSFSSPPPFSPSETAGFLKHRPRYFALNFYTSYWAKPVPGGGEAVDPSTGVKVGFTKEQTRLVEPEGGCAEAARNVSIGLPGAPSWLFSTPWAMRSILNEVNERYRPDEIIVTEKGFATKAEQHVQEEGRERRSGAGGGKTGGAFDDGDRVVFFQSYLESALDVLRLDRVPLTGFCAWSLLDNFEWADGYSMRFGVVRVDFETQRRTVKESALWLREFFSGGKGKSRGSNLTDVDVE